MKQKLFKGRQNKIKIKLNNSNLHKLKNKRAVGFLSS